MVMNIFHVGIAKTGIAERAGFMFKMLVNVFGTSPDKACANAVYLASDEAVNFSGYFLDKPGKPQHKIKVAHDAAMASKLWDRSLELLKQAVYIIRPHSCVSPSLCLLNFPAHLPCR